MSPGRNAMAWRVTPTGSAVPCGAHSSGGYVIHPGGAVTASVVDNERVVFNVGGNKYRLVVKLWFPGQVVWIKFIGTHGSYDRIEVKKL